MAPDKAPAFSFYAKDFLLGTVTMSLAERGAYITLLAYQWDTGGVPSDSSTLGRVLACSTTQAAKAWLSIRYKFQQGPDGLWRNARLELERLKQADRRAALSANGQKGGRPRNQTETRRFSDPKPNGNQTESLPSPFPSPSPVVSSKPQTEHLSVEPTAEALDLRAGHLVERYAELFYLHRRGARYHSRLHIDFMKAQELVRTWADDARLEKLAVIILETDDEWIARTDRGFAVFAAKATWADDRLKAWEEEHGLAV